MQWKCRSWTKGPNLPQHFITVCQHRVLHSSPCLQPGNTVVTRSDGTSGTLFKVAFDKACSYETPMTDAPLDELNDFTFAHLVCVLWTWTESFGETHGVVTQFAGRRLLGPTSIRARLDI